MVKSFIIGEVMEGLLPFKIEHLSVKKFIAKNYIYLDT
jgi:hypothetical protein